MSAEAVISIYSQEAQQYIVRNLPRLRAGYEEQARRCALTAFAQPTSQRCLGTTRDSAATAEGLQHAEFSCRCCRYCAGEDVLEQAFRLNFAPCIVIRGHLLTLLGLSKQVP